MRFLLFVAYEYNAIRVFVVLTSIVAGILNLGTIIHMHVVIAIHTRIVLSRDEYYLPKGLWYVNKNLLILAWLYLRHMVMRKLCCLAVLLFPLKS